jgi:hypothetical protein
MHEHQREAVQPHQQGIVCDLCESHTIEPGADVVLMIRGQVMRDIEGGGYIFIPEPDAEMTVEQLPNGQFAMKVKPSGDIHVAESPCVNFFMEDEKGSRPEAAIQEALNDEMYGY